MLILVWTPNSSPLKWAAWHLASDCFEANSGVFLRRIKNSIKIRCVHGCRSPRKVGSVHCLIKLVIFGVRKGKLSLVDAYGSLWLLTSTIGVNRCNVRCLVKDERCVGYFLQLNQTGQIFGVKKASSLSHWHIVCGCSQLHWSWQLSKHAGAGQKTWKALHVSVIRWTELDVLW
jgi:hypothetical protein